MIINKNSVQTPIVDIASTSSPLSDLPNLLTATNRNNQTQINEFIINFNFFIAEPIVCAEVSIFGNKDLLFGPSPPYYKRSISEKHQFIFRFQPEKEFLPRSKKHRISYYEESSIAEIMNSSIYKLSLEIKTVSMIYKYNTPVLIKNSCLMTKKNNSNILINERKTDFINYLIGIKRDANFHMEDLPKTPTDSPAPKKRKNLDAGSPEPKRKKLNPKTIEKSDNDTLSQATP